MVQNIQVNSDYNISKENQIYRNYTNTSTTKEDTLEIKKVDKSNNGKFDISEAGKNFIKGVLSPLTAVVKHPVITIAMLGTTAAMCSLIPVLTPILGIGFGALSVFQLGKGCIEVAKNIKNKEYDKAEKSFNTVGQGTVGTVLSALGLKQSAKVAKEAKLMSELKVNSLSAAQKEAIAAEVNNGSYLNALKENISLFTTKTGLKATINQFKPSNIIQRGKDAFKLIFGKKERADKVIRKKTNFKNTAEGKRRAALSTEEIEAEVKSLAKEAFDECGIPEELRPSIKVVQESAKKGGGYQSGTHEITINENSYREGFFDLPNTIRHEATHAKEAILRQRLPMDKKVQLTKEYLISKIQNGDNENVITDGSLFGAITSKPPKLNAQMKSDFIKLAQDKLYIDGTIYTDEQLSAMVRPLVEANSEFSSAYSSVDDAVKAMAEYAKSHNFRYNLALKNSTGFNTSKIETSIIKELSPEETQAAIKSYLDAIECTEGNMAGQGGILGIGGDFNQYQFCSEEVLAQTEGNNFEIAKLEQQLKSLRNQPKRNFKEEARIMDLIREAKLTIEYKTKGVEYYKLYTESINHPENKELAAQVAKLKKELDAIQIKIFKTNIPIATDSFGNNVKVISNDYIAIPFLKGQETGASIVIPAATTTAADILADNMKEKVD